MQLFVPRGTKASLPNGSLPEVISSHLLQLIKKTGGINGSIGKQFIAQPQIEKQGLNPNLNDPYLEEKYTVAPGLVYKYKGRTLLTITYSCASYCRFCMRGRKVGKITQNPLLSDLEINQVFHYLENHPEINEVILSGGDPLTCSEIYLSKIIEGLVKLQKKGALSIVRISTRIPIHNPKLIKDWHYKLIAKIKNPYLIVHVNHPSELTAETLTVIDDFRRKSHAITLGQGVLLKGVNDKVETLCKLFTKMVKEGIIPYCLYQNDPVPWAKHFTVPIKKAIKIWQEVRPRLSGIAATAKFIIEPKMGYGKIPVPESDAWSINYSHFLISKIKNTNSTIFKFCLNDYEGTFSGSINISKESASYRFFDVRNLPDKVAYKHREAINDRLKL